MKDKKISEVMKKIYIADIIIVVLAFVFMILKIIYLLGKNDAPKYVDVLAYISSALLILSLVLLLVSIPLEKVLLKANNKNTKKNRGK